MTFQSSSQAVEKLILARLLGARPRGTSAQQVSKDLAPLVEHRYAGGRWETLFQTSLQHLKDCGWIDSPSLAKGRQKQAGSGKLVLTSAGEEEALKFLGVDDLPAQAKWTTIRNGYLPALSLKVSPTAAHVKQLGSLAGLQGAILRKEFGVGKKECPTLKQALDGLLWKQLGAATEKPFSLKAVQEFLLTKIIPVPRELNLSQLKKMIPAMAVGARRTDATELRLALLRRLVDGEETEPMPREPAAHDPEAFADAVLEAARSCQTGRFGPDKVFISHVWRRFGELNPGHLFSEADFKERLVQANRAGLLTLSRADLVQAMNPEDVANSETRYLNALFHFVRL